MSAQPKVSVIVIFFNEERFLTEAVESVLAQTFSDWEMLLVDDGSSDGSSEMARAYARSQPDRVRYLEHPGHENRGMSATRNLGLQAARGELIAFLDADDVWYPDKLEHQVASLGAHPSAALVTGRKEYWYSWAGADAGDMRDFLQPLDVPLDALVAPPSVLTAFLRNQYACLLDILVRKSAIDAVGGYEQAFRGMYEDQVFHAKLCLRFPVWTADHAWHRYRQHPHSCVSVSAAHGQKERARMRFLDWLSGYLDEQQITDRQLRRALNAELFASKYPRFTQARQAFWRFRQAVKQRVAGGRPAWGKS